MKLESAASELVAILRRCHGRRVLVLADLVADEFVHGRVERVSREAPVLILRHEGSEVRLGGGANAVHNIRTLGGVPLPIGVLGRDVHGALVKALLREAGISTARVFTDPAYATPVKTRILAGGSHSTQQQIVRIDKLLPLGEAGPLRRRVLAALASAPRVDAVLVSDYGLGLLSRPVVEAALALARRRKIPVTVDSRYGLLAFRGMTAVTPNEPELEAALGIVIGDDPKRLESAGRGALGRLGAAAVLVTRGSHGMALFEPGQKTVHVPVYGSDQVADVTGAGDTVIATFTLALAAGATPAQAARLANYAGGIVVMKRGTATASAAELSRVLVEDLG
jgi:rfaE bifunctional protein kinase chain/domain